MRNVPGAMVLIGEIAALLSAAPLNTQDALQYRYGQRLLLSTARGC
jgi:hypothetical protein